MKKLRVFIKYIIRNEYLPLWIFAGIQLIYHICMSEPPESDAAWFFSKQLDTYTLKDYLETRYAVWSSRLLIEAVLVFVAKSMLWWRILDFIFWVFLAWAITGLFPEEKRELAGYLTVGFLCLYPVWDLKTAGWIATGVNYTWPLALGIFSLHGAARACSGKKTPVYLWVLYGLSALYGANMEQMCAVLLAVNCGVLFYCILQKKPPRLYGSVIVGTLAVFAEFVFIVTCPGNEARKSQEIISWMPNFESYHFLDKASMGFMDTMRHLLTSGNLLFLCYLILLAVFVFLKAKQTAFRAAAVFPVFVTVWISWFPNAVKANFPAFWKLVDKGDFICGSNYHMAANYIPVVLFLCVVGCMLLSLTAVCESLTELLAQLYLLALGLATRVVMGFTPTIYVSQERTFLFLYMILGISAAYLVVNHQKTLKENRNIWQTMKAAGVTLAVLGVLLDLAEIGSF